MQKSEQIRQSISLPQAHRLGGRPAATFHALRHHCVDLAKVVEDACFDGLNEEMKASSFPQRLSTHTRIYLLNATLQQLVHLLAKRLHNTRMMRLNHVQVQFVNRRLDAER